MTSHEEASDAKSAPRQPWSRREGVLALLATILALVGIAIAPAGVKAAAPDLLWQSPLNGEAGSDVGQFKSPESIATNPTTGHVYVVDQGNLRISEFDAWGEFVKAWGWGVANGAQELQTCGPKATPPTATCQRGSLGTKPGQLGANVSDFPLGGIAVDPVGDIYVGDMANARVQKFDSEGNFLLMIGGEVDKGPNHLGNVCTAAYITEGDSCGAGTAGTGDGQFDTRDNAPVFGNHIAVGPAGTLFVGDENGRIQEFDSTGTFKAKVLLEGKLNNNAVHPNALLSLAVDGTANFHVIAYGESKKLFTFSPGGALISTIAVNLNGESPLALDAAGNIYVVAQRSGNGGEVIEFGPSGEAIIPVGSGFAASEGALADGGFGIQGLATTTVTNVGGTDIYVSGVAVENVNEGLSFVRSYGPPPGRWAPPSFPPEIRSQYTTSVDANGAVLRAQINPRFWADTTYYVEYGTGKCSEGGCTNLLPAPPGNQLGAGMVNASITTTSIFLEDLSPGTTYHYRFVAQSGGGGPAHGVEPGEVEGTFTTIGALKPPNTNCPNQVFRTAASAQLVDCRAYEMVSPVEKNNNDISTLINLDTNRIVLNQSANEGSALTYTTSQGFGDAQGVPYLSQYLATRTQDGWLNHGITPRQGLTLIFAGRRLEPQFKAFTSDLCSGALHFGADPPLAEGGVEGVFNLYRRHNCDEEGYEALTTSVPPNLLAESNTSFFEPEVQGLTADGDCTVFRANDQLTPDATSGKPEVGSVLQVYESCSGQLHLISVLPNGQSNASGASTGTGNGDLPGFRTGATDFQAVSADGSRVYWTASPNQQGQIFVRVNATQEQSKVSGSKCTEEEKACTFKVSQLVSNATGRFLGAAKDGSKAIFRIEDSTSPLDGNLYEFDLESKKATLIATKVAGVMGMDREAARIYFLSREAIAASDSPEGKSPLLGRPNLYFYEKTEEGADIDFLGVVSVEDANPASKAEVTPVSVFAHKHTSRVTPDGRHIAFMSRANLTGYDNTDVKTGESDAEIYTYGTDTTKLSCVSCNPSGVRPSGRYVPMDGVQLEGNAGLTPAAALLPPLTNELYGTRVISDDGSRVFFNSYEALLSHDTNGKIDVYEWERRGSGDCSEESFAFSPPNNGCLSLISSGESPTDSEFVDASANATDVFFATASSLLPQDPGLIDIYDARASGGYPAPPTPPPSCEGEACQGPLAPPNDPTPASSAFEGAGNVKAEKKAHKKKVHKKKSAKKHAAKKHKRAKNKGRAGR